MEDDLEYNDIFGYYIESKIDEWKDKNGKIWKVKDMSDRYLLNVIRYLEKSNYYNKKEHIDFMNNEIEERLKNRYGFF